jgi:hypothetical protein
MEGDQVVIMQKDLPTKQFTYRSGQLVAENRNDPPLIKKALATSAWTSMAYEKSLYRLPKPAMALATK